MSTSPYFSVVSRLTRRGAQTLASKVTAVNDASPTIKQNTLITKCQNQKRTRVKLEYTAEETVVKSRRFSSTNSTEQLFEATNTIPSPALPTDESCPSHVSDAVSTTSTGAEDKWLPPAWKLQLDNMFEMRKERNAPVDSMGCDVISDRNATPDEYRYQVLLSLMLSSQTKDELTSAAMKKLRDHGCNIENILQTSDQKLGELIYPVGFWNKKVEFIKRTTKILKEQGGDIPRTVDALCKLPGVGPKMAYLVMKCAWGDVCGIGVDTHVHRISNRLGWVRKTTKNPEDTRKALEGWLPRDYWSEINHLMVGFGQQICLPVRPKCSSCLNNEICLEGRKTVPIDRKTSYTPKY